MVSCVCGPNVIDPGDLVLQFVRMVRECIAPRGGVTGLGQGPSGVWQVGALVGGIPVILVAMGVGGRDLAALLR